MRKENFVPLGILALAAVPPTIVGTISHVCGAPWEDVPSWAIYVGSPVGIIIWLTARWAYGWK